ncbi:hypothetical protein QQ054_04935 [Oscillatoria amoena NRMC-F 0135]|nr:hypothetical protein [Oscillatoria amoena NRMC-F 0135]
MIHNNRSRNVFLVICCGLISLMAVSVVSIVREFDQLKNPRENLIGYNLPRFMVAEVELFNQNQLDNFLSTDEAEYHPWGKRTITRLGAERISKNYFVTGERLEKMGMPLHKDYQPPKFYSEVLLKISLENVVYHIFFLILSLLGMIALLIWKNHRLKKQISFLYSKL